MSNQAADQDSVLAKIKKCLKLSKSSNANEAQVALRQAHALMKKHNLSMNDVELSEIVTAQVNADTKTKVPDWTAELIRVIAVLLECEVMFNRFIGGNKKMIINFVGAKENTEIAVYTFTVLYRALKKQRKDFIAEQAAQKHLSPANKVRVGDAFCQGWVIAVREKIKDLIQQEKTPEEQAFADRVQSYVHQKTKSVTMKPTSRSKQGLAKYAQEGFRDGSNVDLHIGVHSKGKKQALLTQVNK